MKKSWILIALTVLLLGIVIYIYQGNKLQPTSPASPEKGPVSVSEGVNTPVTSETEEGLDIEVIAENLEIPWEIAFLPDGEILITERPGRLLKIGDDRSVIEVSGVHHIGEGGLLGMALHPQFQSNQLIYLYLTSSDGGQIINRVERYKLDGNTLNDRLVILSGIKGASNHDGGRIKFGPDGYLYITTGDAQQSQLAQDINSLNGKILRVTENGEIPSNNPFGNAVYSYGHRNVQGLAWDSGGRLWATEHGRSGVLSGLDELNLIEPGKNYGWPEIQGDETKESMVSPVIHSGATQTWAPSGAEFLNGSIFFAGLRGETLYQAKLNETNVKSLVKHFQGEYGRLRNAKLGPDGYLYIATSNRDGRGKVKENDDKLIRINPQIFNK